MEKIYCGQSGSAAVRTCHRLSDIPLPEEILSAFLSFYGEDILLRPAQENALFENDILNCADNLIIATPTNSGKSLLSYILLFQEAAKGSVSVLVEPLRALAYEKSEELKRIAEILKKQSTLTHTKIMPDDMRKRKIDMADEIFVVNVGGYIGASTRSEIEYAKATNKPVRYLEEAL